MKKLLLVGALALFGVVNAQTQKGNWMLSGKAEIGFNSTNAKHEVNGSALVENKVSTFKFNPASSYFVIDNLALGLGLGYQSEKSGVTTQNTFAILPQATYFFSVAGNVKPYLEATVGYANSKMTSNNSDAKFGGLAYGFGGGIAYLFNTNVAMTLGVNYLSTNLKNSENSNYVIKGSNLGVGAGIAVFLK